jgi:hypothetical protein
MNDERPRHTRRGLNPLLTTLLLICTGTSQAEEARKRFIIDNDGSNLFWMKTLADDDLKWAADQCPKSVTTYLVCLGAGTFYYPCKVGEIVPARMAPALNAAIARGEDPPGRFFEYLRKAGKEIFITYRMNDVHNANDKDDWNISGFRKKHPDCIVGADEVKAGRADWMSYCLDYSRPEVRAFVLSSLADMAGRYDIDGFQLDWMRFPRHLAGRGDEVWAKRGGITEFTASVRTMLDKVGNGRGKRILLAARVPTTPDGCRRLGVDVAEWARLKLIDFLTPAPFLSCDTIIPIDEFRVLMGANAVPIYAGTDMNHSGRCHTVESYRGWAMGVYDQGADGLNLFNFPCWTEYLADQPYEWVADLDAPAKIRGKPALYTLVTTMHRAGVDAPTPLPRPVAAGKSVDLSLRLPVTALPASRALLLIAAGPDAGVSINGTALTNPRRPSSANIFMAFLDKDLMSREPDMNLCRVFMVSPPVLKPGVNAIRVTNKGKADATIVRLDLGLWY